MRDASLMSRIGREGTMGVLLACLAGCTSWHALPSSLPAPSDVAHPHVRVTLRSGQRLDLQDASITGDSLVGGEERPWSFSSRRRRRALPVSEIEKLEVPRFSAERTVLAAAGVAVVSAVIIPAIIHYVDRNVDLRWHLF